MSFHLRLIDLNAAFVSDAAVQNHRWAQRFAKGWLMPTNPLTILFLLFVVSGSLVSLAHAQTLSNPPYGQNQTVNQNRH